MSLNRERSRQWKIEPRQKVDVFLGVVLHQIFCSGFSGLVDLHLFEKVVVDNQGVCKSEPMGLHRVVQAIVVVGYISVIEIRYITLRHELPLNLLSNLSVFWETRSVLRIHFEIPAMNHKRVERHIVKLLQSRFRRDSFRPTNGTSFP